MRARASARARGELALCAAPRFERAESVLLLVNGGVVIIIIIIVLAERPSRVFQILINIGDRSTHEVDLHPSLTPLTLRSGQRRAWSLVQVLSLQVRDLVDLEQLSVASTFELDGLRVAFGFREWDGASCARVDCRYERDDCRGDGDDLHGVRHETSRDEVRGWRCWFSQTWCGCEKGCEVTVDSDQQTLSQRRKDEKRR